MKRIKTRWVRVRVRAIVQQVDERRRALQEITICITRHTPPVQICHFAREQKNSHVISRHTSPVQICHNMDEADVVRPLICMVLLWIAKKGVQS